LSFSFRFLYTVKLQNEMTEKTKDFCSTQTFQTLIEGSMLPEYIIQIKHNELCCKKHQNYSGRLSKCGTQI